MLDFEARLAELAELKDDWDSYGGSPPHPDAIEHARQLLEHCFIVPTNNGGVCIELHEVDIDIDVEIDRNGVKSLYYSLHGTTDLVEREEEI